MPRYIDADKLQTDMMEMVASGLYGPEDMIDAVIEAPAVSPDEVRGAGNWIKRAKVRENLPEDSDYLYSCSVCGRGDVHNALVRAYKDRAWKSYCHEDGELCFGGGWFIVGIDTPEGSYTYHYENKDFDEFDCVELPRGKHWDGHTEKDVTRLLSLPEPLKEETE